MSGKRESVVDVQGTVEDGFEPVRDAFVDNFARRGERGAAVACYLHGRKVADLWGGTKDGGAAALAAQAPVWEPGSEHGYHAQTYSWLIGELVLRVTGRSLGSWVAEEISGPLGLEMWIGLPEGERSRVGRLAEIEPPAAAG